MMTGKKITNALTVAVVAIGIVVAGTAQAGTAAYNAEVLSDSPIVYLPFDEALGTTADNVGSLGATHDGTINGGVTLAQGSFTNGGTAFGFSNTAGDYVLLDTVLPSALTEWTVEYWMKWTGKTTRSATWGQDQSGFNDDVIGGLGTPQAYTPGYSTIDLHGGAGAGRDSVGVPMSSDVWHHAVVTTSAGAGEIKLYIDGDLKTTINPLLSNGALGNGQQITIGDGRPAGGWPFQGLIDEFAIYGSVLDAATIQSHYNVGISGGGTTATPGTLIYGK